MAIDGKKRYVVYLVEEDVKVIKEWLDTRPGAGGLSELVQKHVHRCAEIIRRNPVKLGKIEPGKMTVKKFIQFAMLDMP